MSIFHFFFISAWTSHILCAQWPCDTDWIVLLQPPLWEGINGALLLLAYLNFLALVTTPISPQ